MKDGILSIKHTTDKAKIIMRKQDVTYILSTSGFTDGVITSDKQAVMTCGYIRYTLNDLLSLID